MEYYEKNGKIGVLVSPGYGAGWSTWGTPELAYDKRIVEFWLSHKDDAEFMRTVNEFGSFGRDESESHKEADAFFKSIGYEKCPYMGGFDDIVLEFVTRGTPFRISEYDGYESIETFENAGFTTF